MNLENLIVNAEHFKLYHAISVYKYAKVALYAVYLSTQI